MAHVHMCTNVHKCAYVHMCTFVHICAHVRAHVHKCAQMATLMQMCSQCPSQKHQKQLGKINVWSVPKSHGKYLIKRVENGSLSGSFPETYQKRHQKQLAFPCLRDVAGRLGKTSGNYWKYQRFGAPWKVMGHTLCTCAHGP